MSREILFKAKRIDNGEWIEGNLIIDERCQYKKYIGYIFDVKCGVIEDFDITEVIPNTVCQYTGLTDGNDEKIWENDIVKTTHYIPGYIVWNQKSCGWYIKLIRTGSEIPLVSLYRNEIRRMGNILDMPIQYND